MQSTRTGAGIHLNNCLMLRRPFTVLPNSTLNQKFNLFKDELPLNGEYPVLGYIGIGNKGARYELTTSNFLLTQQVEHLSRHAALYNHIPFVVRPIDDDLAAEERIKYRLRVPVTVGGVNYVAYYLRALALDIVTPELELRNITAGTVTTMPFTNVIGDLSPTHPDISSIDLNNPDGDYLVGTSKIALTLNKADITNIIDACTILFGDPRYAVINEIALCSGIDRVLQGNFGSATSGYMELVAAQVAAFIYQSHNLTDTTNEVTIRLDVGSSELLLT